MTDTTTETDTDTETPMGLFCDHELKLFADDPGARSQYLDALQQDLADAYWVVIELDAGRDVPISDLFKAIRTWKRFHSGYLVKLFAEAASGLFKQLVDAQLGAGDTLVDMLTQAHEDAANHDQP